MKIKKLELLGFKSFKDRTVIQFDEGITGVVGPNGCGKSNIVDALIWVMGEQSAKHLRGASMEDVIFAGAEGYAPMGLAEVSLTLENDGGSFPARYSKFSEVMITRRLHRSGESEYLINKEQARLRDIQEIFMDTGVGSKGFSIIEQGAIGKIITAKPQDRRNLIEEAAGITKFKVRKRESEKKLAATDQNLLRLNDIIGEIRRQLDSLERQAKKAEKYRELKRSSRDLDLWLSCHQYTQLKADLEQTQRDLEGIENQSFENQNRVSELEASLQEMKTLLTEVEKQVHQRQTQRYEAQASVQKKENEIQRIQFEIEQAERSERMTGSLLQELEVRNRALQVDVSQTTSKLQQLSQESEMAQFQSKEQTEQLQNLREQLLKADDEIVGNRKSFVTVNQAKTHVQAQMGAAEGRIKDLQERKERSQAVLTELEAKQDEFQRVRKKYFDELERERQLQLAVMHDVENFLANKTLLEQDAEQKKQDLENKKDRLNKVDSRLYGLQNLDNSLEGYQEGVKQIMNWQKDQNLQLNLVANLFQVPAEYEVAVESVLGQRMQLILAENLQDTQSAIQALKTNQWGRSSFAILDGRANVEISSKPPLPCLADVIQSFDEKHHALVQSLFYQVAVADSLHDALELSQKYPQWTFVALDGDMVTSDGIVSGGTKESADTGFLRRRREMKELGLEKDQWSTQVSVAAIEMGRLDERLETLQKDLDNAQKHKIEKEIIIAERKKDLERAENELQNLITALKRQNIELEDLKAQLAAQEEKFSQCQNEISKFSLQEIELQSKIESLEQDLLSRRFKVEENHKVATELQVKAAAKLQEAEGVRRQLEMYQASLSDVQSQISKMSQESLKSTQTMSDSQVVLAEEKLRLEQLIAQTEEMARQLSQTQNEFEKLNANIRAQESQVFELNRVKLEILNKSSELKLKQEQLHLRDNNLVSQIFEKYNASLETVYPEYKDRVGDMVAIEAELMELKDKLSRMGEVSLTAIEEYDELTKRFEFLTKQQADLLASQEQLRKVIEKIDRICSKQFQETFEAVNERFKRVFPVLFGGGEAHLVMVQEEGESDPGLDIVVRPPGKKMQNITLLSGGEKALSSVALIFSIFLVKPSPFCLLDEVDAPLDDANVFRFNELVREMSKRSQIIVVTHNKFTMEVNNRLYGVTMEERGVSKMVSVNLKDKDPAKRPAEVSV